MSQITVKHVGFSKDMRGDSSVESLFSGLVLGKVLQVRTRKGSRGLASGVSSVTPTHMGFMFAPFSGDISKQINASEGRATQKALEILHADTLHKLSANDYELLKSLASSVKPSDDDNAAYIARMMA